MHSSRRFTCRNQTGCTCLVCPRLLGMQPCPSPLGSDSLAQPLARHGQGKTPMLLLNCENKKPLPTLACVQRQTDEYNRHMSQCTCAQAEAPEAKPRDTWGAVPGEAIYASGSDLGAHPALPPQRDTAKNPAGPSRRWHRVHGSSEMPLKPLLSDQPEISHLVSPQGWE